MSVLKKQMVWFWLLVSFGDVCICAQLPDGFSGAAWGSSPDQVKSAINPAQWSALPADNAFPQELNVTRFRASQSIAGYSATVMYYFFENGLFQATVSFNFDRFKTYDFNYNVFRSVDGYYSVIHDQTITFVDDIYVLLSKKYGKKEPFFKGLDPRWIFRDLDVYFKQERWNFRYHPYDYYKRIVSAAYAQWDFPLTRVIFSINISAADKRFDYTLSAASIKIAALVSAKSDSLRMKGL